MKTVGKFVWRAVILEITIWVTLYRWLMRRPVGAGADTHAFSYASAMTPMVLIFILINAIEIPALHLLIPWPSVQLAFLVLGIWSLLWMVGYLAILKTRPHLVGPMGMRIRYGHDVDFTIPWAAIAGLHGELKFPEGSRRLRLRESECGTVLDVVVANQTNICVKLREPMELELPKGLAIVSEVHFYVDDAGGLLARCHTTLVS